MCPYIDKAVVSGQDLPVCASIKTVGRDGKPVPYDETPIYEDNKISGEPITEASFVYASKTKTEMKNHFCLLIIKFAQTIIEVSFAYFSFQRKVGAKKKGAESRPFLFLFEFIQRRRCYLCLRSLLTLISLRQPHLR